MTSEAIQQRTEYHLQIAERMFGARGYEACVSRSYYAMFYLARALVRLAGLRARTPEGIHDLFKQHFIETEKLPDTLEKMLRDALALRQKSASTSKLVISPEEAESVLESARHFVTQAQELLHADTDQRPLLSRTNGKADRHTAVLNPLNDSAVR